MPPTGHVRLPSRLLAAGVALLVGAGLALPSYAADSGRRPAPPPHAQADEHAAERALENAQAALAGEADLEPTLALAELATVVGELEGEDREEARALFARPDDAEGDPYLGYSEAPSTFCGTHTCVHHADSGVDRPPGGDADGDEVPDWVELTAATLDRVWSVETGGLGYRPPRGDGQRGNPPGETRADLIDVYLGDVGAQQIFGYAAVDLKSDTPYLVLDNDFADFGVSTFRKRRGLLRVTAAHEFFHAVQFGYDIAEDAWFLEATATWVEDEVYDDVDDNRFYLPDSAMQVPGRSLDTLRGLTPYGNWILFRFATERHGAALVREMWEEAARDGSYSVLAMQRTLRRRGTSLPDAFGDFASGNNAPRRFYDEGRAYQPSPVARRWTLSTGTPGTGRETATLRHLASRSWSLKPGRSLTARWRLRVRVNGPRSVSEARVLVHRRDGRVDQRTVSLNRYGNGSIRVPFRRGPVRKVTLTLANASMSYSCGTGGAYACNGTPRDNKREFRFWARAVR